MANLGDLMMRLGVDLAPFNTAMGSMSDKLKEAERDAASSWSGFEKLGSRMTSVGMGLSAAVTAPIVGIAAASAAAFSGFESSMNRVSALGEITGKDLDKLKAQAIDLGAKTQFSAKQAADGMAELAAAGFKTTDVMTAMPAVLNLAASGQMSVGQASETAANIMGGFNIKADGVGHAVDVMAKAAASGSLSVSDLGFTFKYVGPVATAAGLSFEEMAAATTLMSNAGIKGEQAGTTLRMALTRLLDPPKAAAEALAALGVSTTDAGGKMLPLNRIIEQLGEKGATTSQIMKIFGAEAGSGMQALVTKGAPALRSMTEELIKSDGAAAKMAGTLNSGLAGSMERMKGSIETAGIALGEVLAPNISALAGLIEQGANKLAEFAQWFHSLPEPIQTTSLALVAVIAAVGPLLVVAGQLAGAITAIHAATALASPLLATLGGSVLPVLGSALLVVAAGFAAWELGRWIRETTGLGKAIDDLLDKVGFATKVTKEETRATNDQAFAEKKLAEAKQRSAERTAEATIKTNAAKSASAAMEAAVKRTTDSLAKQTAGLKSASDQSADYVAKSHPLVQRNEVLFAMQQKLESQYKKTASEIAAWKLAHADAASVLPRLIDVSQSLGDTIQQMSVKMSNARTVSGVFADGLKADMESARKIGQEQFGGIASDAEGLAGKAKGSFGKIGTDLSGVLGNAKTSWTTWTNQVSTILTDFGSQAAKSLWDGDMSFGKKGAEVLKSLGEAATRMFVEPATKAMTDLMQGTIKDLIGGNGFGGVVDSVKAAGRAIADVFGHGGGSAAGAAGSAAGGIGGAGSAAGSVGGVGGSAGSIGGAAASGGTAALVGAVAGVGTLISSVIGNFQNAHQETSLNAIEHNTRYGMMFLGERSDGGILGTLFRVAEYLQYAPAQLDGINAKLSDWLAPLSGMMDGIRGQFGMALTRLDQIGNDVMYGSQADRDHSGLLTDIRDTLRKSAGMVVTINVSGAASPTATADAIALRLRTQGAIA